MSAERVLRALAAGERSGAALARELGVTRSAVWKSVEGLRALGIEVEASAGRGYRLARPLELLDADAIAASLSPRARDLLRALDVVFDLDSTSSTLLALAPGDAHGRVLFAEHQRAGRGRRGRAWHSPLGANLYVSFGWRFERGPAALTGLSLALGVATHDALARCGVEGVALKWPNDLVVGPRKLGGILVELGGELGGPCDVVAGIGLNVAMPHRAARSIEQPWIDVATLSPQVSRAALAAALADSVLLALDRYARDGYAAFRDAYARADALRGAEVRVLLGSESVEGRALGTDEAGLLRVCVDGVERRYASGEVSVRAA